MRYLLVCGFMLVPAALAFGKDPDCAGTDRWPATMAFVHLKNAGLTNNDRVDFDKTKVTRLASEKVGKDLYRQVYDILFTERSGAVVEVITVSDASSTECSMSPVDVFVVSRHLER